MLTFLEESYALLIFLTAEHHNATTTKRSICTVWKFHILLSLRFYVKSILKTSKAVKLSLLLFYGHCILLIWQISNFKKCKTSKINNFRSSKCVRMADFDTLDQSTLISVKYEWKKNSVISTLHWGQQLTTLCTLWNSLV